MADVFDGVVDWLVVRSGLAFFVFFPIARNADAAFINARGLLFVSVFSLNS